MAPATTPRTSGAAGLVDAISGLLVLDLGSGTDAVTVDDSADTDDNLGTLTQTTLTGLDMVAPAGFGRLYSITLGAGATTFQVTLGTLTQTFATGISAAALRDGLQSLLFPGVSTCGTAGLSRCSTSVYVWKVGGDYLVGFQGELRGALAPALAATSPTGTATDVLRVDGLNYYGLETLALATGSGHDRLNVRGTLPATSIDTGAGDDLVYVSGAANLGALPAAAAISGGDLATLHAAILHGTVVVDDLVFTGSLDWIQGALTIQVGAGSNTLSVSDRADPDADGAVTITQSTIAGLAPALITYEATGGDLAGQGHWALSADSGLFGRGFNVYAGTGGNHIAVTSVLGSAPSAPFGASITTIFAGAGTDTVIVSVAAAAGRILAVHGETGDDTIDGSASTVPLLLFGDGGSDRLTGGSAGDRILGDDGRVVYLRPAGAPGFDIVVGGAPVATGAVADGTFLTTDAILTVDTSIGSSAGDTISGGPGDDLILGGAGGDTIDGGDGFNVIFGDFGRAYFLDGLLDSATSTEPELGGDDTIVSGAGDDVIVAGAGNDTVDMGAGFAVVLGDSGELDFSAGVIVRAASIAPGLGGNDTIVGGSSSAVVIGGFGADTITVGGGTNLILGDNGFIDWISADGDPTDIDEVSSTSPGIGGNDTITTGAGNTIAIGGAGDDLIVGGSGSNVILGDNGRILAASAAGPRFGGLALTLGRVETIAPGIGGRDTISGGSTANVILGGADRDSITAAGGTNLILGDEGFVDWVIADGDPTDIDVVSSTNPEIGGDDTITIGTGNVIAIGGYGNDLIIGGTGTNVILGDSGRIVAAVPDAPRFGALMITLGRVETIAPLYGGNDAITGGSTANVILGGSGADSITAAGGTNLILGDNGFIDWVSADGDPTDIDEVSSTDTSYGGNDTITIGTGNVIAIGGYGDDVILGGTGSNVILGDSGRIVAAVLDAPRFGGATGLPITLGRVETIAPGVGGRDTITGGSTANVILGGAAGDTITAPGGTNLILGDEGFIDWVIADGDPSDIDLVSTTNPEIGGDDTIVTGTGSTIAIGGFGNDLIIGGTGANLILGDSGRIVAALVDAPRFGALPITVGRVETIAPEFGGSDTIVTGAVNDIVLGGSGADTITDGGGNNVILGDNGVVDYVGNDGDPTDIDRIAATDPTFGGSDRITISGPGNNYVIGGTGGDFITTGESNDLIFGDFGELVGDIPATIPSDLATFTYTSIFTANADGGGDDEIRAGDGRNIVIGGQGNDLVVTGSGKDDIVGGHNVAGGQDGNDRIDSGAGDDVVAGDNARIFVNGGVLDPRVRSLTWFTIYSVVVNADGSYSYVPNVTSARPNPTGVTQRTVLLFDGGTADTTLYGNDSIAGGAGDDLLFGQMGNDTIQGDGELGQPVGTRLAPGHSVERATDGDDYIEGGGGDDLIFGNLGQDDILGGSSPFFLAPGTGRPDGADTIFGGAGTRIGIDDAGDTSPNGHGRDADVILGDNGIIYRLVDWTTGQFLGFNYDNTPGSTTRIIARAIVLLDYDARGDSSYVTNSPFLPPQGFVVTGDPLRNTNIGGADTIHGEGGDDVIHGQTGNDTLFGDGQDDTLYGESGNDWISGGTGDDGVLGDDGLLTTSRNGIAEPLYGIATTSQVTLSDDGKVGEDDITIFVTGRLTHWADLTPFFSGGHDVIYGGLGNDFLHGGAGDDAISGAEALPVYYDNGRNPLGVLASLGTLYTAGNVLGFNPLTGWFRYYDNADPFRKIVLTKPDGTTIDFLLNFSAGTLGAVRDDGRDAIFGGAGNDWLVGGTNEDHLYGGDGNDLLQADDDLDSTLVPAGTVVTTTSLCNDTKARSTDAKKAADLCKKLTDADSKTKLDDRLKKYQEYQDDVLKLVGDAFTPDQAAYLTRLVQALRGADPLANNIPDPRGTGPSYADVAYGGPGQDVLIANTSSDRLIDWHHDDDTIVAPWSKGEGNGWDGWHGGGSHFDGYLALLAWSDGADSSPQNPWTWGVAPFGELGLLCGSHGSNCDDVDYGHGKDVRAAGRADQGSLAFTVLPGSRFVWKHGFDWDDWGLDDYRTDKTGFAWGWALPSWLSVADGWFWGAGAFRADFATWSIPPSSKKDVCTIPAGWTPGTPLPAACSQPAEWQTWADGWTWGDALPAGWKLAKGWLAGVPVLAGWTLPLDWNSTQQLPADWRLPADWESGKTLLLGWVQPSGWTAWPLLGKHGKDWDDNGWGWGSFWKRGPGWKHWGWGYDWNWKKWGYGIDKDAWKKGWWYGYGYGYIGLGYGWGFGYGWGAGWGYGSSYWGYWKGNKWYPYATAGTWSPACNLPKTWRIGMPLPAGCTLPTGWPTSGPFPTPWIGASGIPGLPFPSGCVLPKGWDPGERLPASCTPDASWYPGRPY